MKMKIVFILIILSCSCFQKYTIDNFRLIAIEDRGEIGNYIQEINFTYEGINGGVVIRFSEFNKEEISLDNYNVGDKKYFKYYIDEFGSVKIIKDKEIDKLNGVFK